MMAANAALTGLAAAPDLLPPDRALDIVGGCSLPGNQHPALVDAAFPAVMEIGEPGSSTSRADAARARPPGTGLAGPPRDHAPRQRRVPRRGFRDLGQLALLAG